MSTITVSYLVYAEGRDTEGNRFYFEKDKTKDVEIQDEDFNGEELNDDVLDAITKEIHSYENKRTSYAFNKSNYKKNNIYNFNDDNPGVTLPIEKVKTTKLEIIDVEVL